MLAETALHRGRSVPEIFNYWLQPGRIDVGFLSGAQIDRFANLNTTVIGEYTEPDVRLPGAGGAPEIAASCREVIVVMRHRPAGVRRPVDFVTSSATAPAAATAGCSGCPAPVPVRVITDLGVLEPDPESARAGASPRCTRASRSSRSRARPAGLWIVADLGESAPPTDEEITILRNLEQTRGPAARDETCRDSGARSRRPGGRLRPVAGARAGGDPARSARQNSTLTLSARSPARTGLARGAARRFLLTLADLGYVRSRRSRSFALTSARPRAGPRLPVEPDAAGARRCRTSSDLVAEVRRV